MLELLRLTALLLMRLSSYLRSWLRMALDLRLLITAGLIGILGDCLEPLGVGPLASCTRLVLSKIILNLKMRNYSVLLFSFLILGIAV